MKVSHVKSFLTSEDTLVGMSFQQALKVVTLWKVIVTSEGLVML